MSIPKHNSDNKLDCSNSDLNGARLGLCNESSEAHGFKSLNEFGKGADVMVYGCGVNGIASVRSLVSAKLRFDNNSTAAERIFDIKLWKDWG